MRSGNTGRFWTLSGRSLGLGSQPYVVFFLFPLALLSEVARLALFQCVLIFQQKKFQSFFFFFLPAAEVLPLGLLHVENVRIPKSTSRNSMDFTVGTKILSGANEPKPAEGRHIGDTGCVPKAPLQPSLCAPQALTFPSFMKDQSGPQSFLRLFSPYSDDKSFSICYLFIVFVLALALI
jgi:hypothetical protein